MPAKNNLQYEAQEPAFLRRLREQNSGQSADGRHERPVARARKPKADDEEDAPAYVDENSNETLSKAEYEALLKPESKSAEGNAGGAQDVNEDETPGVTGELTGTEPKVAGALPNTEEKRESSTKEATVGSKKRKSAKVIGNDEEDPDDEQAQAPTTATKKQKKKGKPIKLSFNNDEES
ncbi:hypothetical protein MBLNU457_3882t1 [Dothideomycetes sp. NU457]